MSAYKAMQRPLLWRLRSGERRLILLLGDAFVAGVALLVAMYFWGQDDWLRFSTQFLRERIPFWFYILPVVWLVLMVELYDVRRAGRRGDTVRGIGIAAIISLGLYLFVYFTSEPNSLPRYGVAIFVVTSAVLTLFWRLLYIRVFTTPLFMRRVLIVGAGRAGSNLVKVIREIWPPPFYLVGLIDDDPGKIGTEVCGYPVLGGSSQLLSLIENQNVTDLVFSISGEMNPQSFQNILTAQEKGVEVTTMPIVYEDLLGRVPILLLQSDWILRSFVDHAHASEFYELAKRLIDIAGGLVGSMILLFLSPFISLAILLDSGSPVLYRQNRLGKNGRTYKIIKFRTMRQDSEKDGKPRPAVANDERVTRVGYFLRKSHLDEFPQFINVLRGDMSLVGPRAERSELVEELQNKVPFYRARFLVKPGLTGWAQINFGYAATVEDTTIKLEYDLYYIKHRNLMMDITIILRTAGSVIGLRGL